MNECGCDWDQWINEWMMINDDVMYVWMIINEWYKYMMMNDVLWCNEWINK